MLAEYSCDRLHVFFLMNCMQLFSNPLIGFNRCVTSVPLLTGDFVLEPSIDTLNIF